jgi:hypothetical protein
VQAERDLKRLKKVYEDALEEVHNKLEDIELKKSCTLIEWLILYFQQERVHACSTSHSLASRSKSTPCMI